MRSLKRFLIVVAVLALLLGVLDRVTCWWAENEGTQALEKRGAENANVTVNDLPFLTSLVAGSINQVDLNIPRLDIATEGGAIPITAVRAQLNQLDLTAGRLNIEKIGQLHAEGNLSQEAFAQLVAAKAPGVKVKLDAGKLAFATQKWGQEILATGQLSLAGGADGLTPTLVIKPTAIQTELPRHLQARLKLPEFLPTINIPITGLPANLQLSAVEIKADHLKFKLTGENIPMQKNSVS